MTFEGGTTVWHWDVPDAPRPEDRRLLSTEELDRAAGMAPRRATEFVTSRAAVRSILSDLFGIPPRHIGLGRRACPGCGGTDHGPPALVHPGTPLWISVSHTVGRGALALSDRPVGVDVEQRRPVELPQLARTVLSTAERQWLDRLPDDRARLLGFFTCWTRKEAVLKAIGVGITGDLSAWHSHPDQSDDIVMDAAADASGAWRVRDLDLGPDWSAAVSGPADALGPLEVHPWPRRPPLTPESSRTGQQMTTTHDRDVLDAVLQFWRELLGVTDIHPDDDFFDLGGTSLRAVRFVLRVRREFGIDLSATALTNAGTARQCAEVIESLRSPDQAASA
ncbi:4'-phosphopantetheinyl transferase superfamily protein [Streptomyces sp. NPDC059979]|uniref:4'-phosphopantetheinyl transferase superfamily protein n=1 Tax=unclassified Streptomyces TaxID=2593676 RepID=UPI003649DD19